MHVWQWLLTGLVAGLLARGVLRRSSIGLWGDLALGSLGGVATGGLLRWAGVIEPGDAVVQVLVALVGAVGMIALMHGAARMALDATRAVVRGAVPGSLPDRIGKLSDSERAAVDTFLERRPVARDTSSEIPETLGERVADRVARFGGSWPFLGLFAVVLLSWMMFNVEAGKPFDPYPFILLNLLLSCVAAVQAPIILMSQNRAAHIDRLQARADYEVNLKAELEILALHEKLDTLRERAWVELAAQQARQIELLEELARRQAKP